MNKDINSDILNIQRKQFIDKKIEELLKENPSIINENKILEIEYNIDGTKKDIYSLASEKDIRETQIKSDLNELEFKFNQNQITKDEYDKKVIDINEKLYEQNLVYNDLIFEIINTNELDDIKKSIESHNLNDIDLKRLANAIKSAIDAIIDEFTENNKQFMIDKISYWNYKYDQLSKAISKSREVESFILGLIE